MRLGNLLRAWRQKNDITLEKLSQDIGINLRTLQRIEAGRGQGKPSKNRYDNRVQVDMRTALKIMEWLFGDSGE